MGTLLLLPLALSSVCASDHTMSPQALAAPAAALQLALPNALGSLLGFVISYTIAGLASGNGWTTDAAPGAKQILHAMNTENIPRFHILSFAVCMAVGLAACHRGAGISMPSFLDQIIYSFWFAMMAMVDEVYDTLPLLSRLRRPIPAYIQILCWVLLLVPIPYLLSVQDVYKLFALQFIGSQIMASKLDLREFKAAVALGVPIILLLVLKSGLEISGTQVVGMFILLLSHIIYETHDENPALIRLREKLGFFPKSAWLIFNQHFQMVLLVLLGALPSQWLCCVTAAYPIAKIGVARGASCGLGVSTKTSQMPNLSVVGASAKARV